MTENDKSTAEMILASGKTAPRITPDIIKATIASENYFTAQDAVCHIPCAEGDVANTPQSLAALGLLTICVLVLKNGFTVLGKSACASPENFDANIGRKVAFEDAFGQVWQLEGYLLKQRLFDEACQYALLHGEVDTVPPFQRRVMTERDELAAKLCKLGAFLVTPTYRRLADEEQTRLADQFEFMRQYLNVLNARIDAFVQA